MAPRRRRVIWTDHASQALDEALEYVAQNSPDAARQLLVDCLASADSLATLSERGRAVAEAGDSTVREILVQRYRLLYEVRSAEVFILALLHGARDFTAWRRGGESDSPAG